MSPASIATGASHDAKIARKRPKIRRTTFACARCHRRKIKCDGLKPACSSCVAAKQSCNGILDGESKTIVPRSIVQYLQGKIAETEAYLQKLGINTDSDVVIQRPMEGQAELSPANECGHVRRWDLAAEASHIFSAGLSKSLLIADANFPMETFLFSSSHLPSATVSQAEPDPIKEEYLHVEVGPNILPQHTEAGSNVLHQIPAAVSERLARNYIEKVLPLYPLLDSRELWTRYEDVQRKRHSGEAPPARYDVFVVSMMLAISIMTSKFSDSSKIASSSERIFQYALQHSETLSETSVLSLQAMLLLIQYSYLMPRAASLWDCEGLAMRTALELGFHRDPKEMSGNPLSAEQADLRRSMFWVLYIFDRSICATSHRRLGVADGSITTKYPAGMENTYFLNNISFRRLQSELWTVNYLVQDTPLEAHQGSYTSWVEDIEHRVMAWRERIASKKTTGPEWFDIAVYHGFVFLHRPCPRNPFPEKESLIKCFDAATQVSAGYWENAHIHFLKYSWHAVHHGFEAAIAMLYAIRHCKQSLKERYGIRKILETVHLFSSLFVLMSERWSRAHASLETYERCKSTIMKELVQMDSAPPMENDELDRLILPPQAQRIRREAGGSMSLREDLQWQAASQEPSFGTISMPVDPGLISGMDMQRALPLLSGSSAAVPGTGAPTSNLPPQTSLMENAQPYEAAPGGLIQYYEGYDMWSSGPNPRNPHQWDDMVISTDSGGLDGMMLWSM